MSCKREVEVMVVPFPAAMRFASLRLWLTPPTGSISTEAESLVTSRFAVVCMTIPRHADHCHGIEGQTPSDQGVVKGYMASVTAEEARKRGGYLARTGQQATCYAPHHGLGPHTTRTFLGPRFPCPRPCAEPTG